MTEEQKNKILEITDKLFTTLGDITPREADAIVARQIVELRKMIEKPVLIKVSPWFIDYKIGEAGKSGISYTMEEIEQEIIK